MKKPSPLLSIGIRYGLITGLLAICLLIASYFLSTGHPLMISPFFDFRILLFGVFIFFCLKEFREDHHGGVFYFWQGMIGSLIFTVVAGTVSSLGLMLYCSLEPDFISNYVVQMTEYLKSFPPEDINLIGQEVYQRNLDQLPSTNVKQIAGLYFMQSLMIGFFVSIILSVILRKLPNPD